MQSSSCDAQWLLTHVLHPAGSDVPATTEISVRGLGQLALAVASPPLLLELPPELPPSSFSFAVESSPGLVFGDPPPLLVDEQANVPANEPTTTKVHATALTIDCLLK